MFNVGNQFCQRHNIDLLPVEKKKKKKKKKKRLRRRLRRSDVYVLHSVWTIIPFMNPSYLAW